MTSSTTTTNSKKEQSKTTTTATTNWTHNLQILPTTTSSSPSSSSEFTIASFNLLAESYLTPRSHSHLPSSYASTVFTPAKRQDLLLQTMDIFAGPQRIRKRDDNIQQKKKEGNGDEGNGGFDIICVQELDLIPLITTHMSSLNYNYAIAERGADPTTKTFSSSPKKNKKNNEATKKERVDSCAIFYDQEKYIEIKRRILQFDDLATLCTSSSENIEEEPTLLTTPKRGSSQHRRKIPPSALSGIVQSYLRRNTALLLLLQNKHTQKCICVGTTHLYWHPHYEYVKLSQAKYVLDTMDTFARVVSKKGGYKRVPCILCGDFNSKPKSVVYEFIQRGVCDGRSVAPWWNMENLEELEEEDRVNGAGGGGGGEKKGNGDNKEEEEELEKENGVVVSRDSSEDEVVMMMMTDEEEEQNQQNEKKENNIQSQETKEEENMKEMMDQLSLNKKAEKNKGVGTSKPQNDTPSIPPPNANVSNTLKQEVTQDYTWPSISTSTASTKELPPIKYLLDNTLNKFTRWLRILGIDAALETDEEEKERTKKGVPNMRIFDRCKSEKRTLITTSYKLLLRKDCPPGTYLIDPKKPSHLEAALVELLLTHGVVLQPRKFLTRCVVCNGRILTVTNEEEKKRIFNEYSAPDLIDQGFKVYACDGCSQGYWWCDRPNSSASRVKNQATRLFQKCLRGGVPIEGELNMFSFFDVEAERRKGKEEEEEEKKKRKENGNKNNGGFVRWRMDVIDWLKDEKLSHPFQMRSAYAVSEEKEANGNASNGSMKGNADSNYNDFAIDGETLPFTNVTSSFVDTLDYIFYEQSRFEKSGELYVPKSFKELNTSGIKNGHLLPSDIWPSDHLAIGVRFRIMDRKKNRNENQDKANDIGMEMLCMPINDSAPSEGISSSYPNLMKLPPKKIQTLQNVSKNETETENHKTNSNTTNEKSIVQNKSKQHVKTSTPTTGVPSSTLLPTPHGQRCACGCIPNTLSLFEMAALRKKYREEQKKKAQQKK